MPESQEWIRVRGARTHNLRDLNVDVPRDRLTVFTGPSGSGKSSLAFDTLHAEGQRRYLETLRCDTRALFSQLQRPDVDLIDGLPPTLCVAQQAGAAQRRSTLATVTEIHDHLRLLWARLGTPHCVQCGEPVIRHTIREIVRHVLTEEDGHKVYVMAPLVRGETGQHREAFQTIRVAGFLRARIDDVLQEVRETPEIDGRKKHTIEMVIDRLVVKTGIDERLAESLATAAKHGNGQVVVTQIDDGDWHDHFFSTKLACPRCGSTFPNLEPRQFSFNSPYGACPTCSGLGQVWELDPARLVPDRSLTLAEVSARLAEQLPASLQVPAPSAKVLASFQELFPGGWDVHGPLAQWPSEAWHALLHGTQSVDPAWPGWLPELRRLSKQAEEDDDAEMGEALDSLAGYLPCQDCGGTRLRREVRCVRFAGKGIDEIAAMTVDAAARFFQEIADDPSASPGARDIRMTLITEIGYRLGFLREVGLGYLTLDRPAPTLSGGEIQRARLATHLGGHLLGVCYILDEPTIGLHPRDTERLITALRGLQRRGNTLVVVEHDEEVIRQADYLVDIGPGAGREGGRLLAAGTLKEVLANPASVTAKYLASGGRKPPDEVAPRLGRSNQGANAPRSPESPILPGSPVLLVRGARHHNLKNVDVAIPLGRLVCLTGVSGSGKSSLARDVICHAVRRHLGLLAPIPGEHDGIDGLEHIDKIIEFDQAPLGRSSRSSPATYTGVYDEIRKVFAATRTAKLRGYKANRFSFNVKGGRCEECQGQGSLRMALQFLPDLSVPCPACHGQRFNRATLEVEYKGQTIANVLDMPIAQALDFFGNVPGIQKPLEALTRVGLGYLSLGQPSSTLSGGEAQRVKLARELARTATGRTLFLLDEPTTGLHFADVANLIGVLRGLVEAGNTLLVIEHHPGLIAAADWVIDLGPGAGDAGGRVLAAGPPEAVAECPESVTGPFLTRSIG